MSALDGAYLRTSPQLTYTSPPVTYGAETMTYASSPVTYAAAQLTDRVDRAYQVTSPLMSSELVHMAYASPPVQVAYASAPAPVAYASASAPVEPATKVTVVRQQPMMQPVIHQVPGWQPSVAELQVQVAELQQALQTESRARQAVEVNLISMKSEFSSLSISVNNAVNIATTTSNNMVSLEVFNQFQNEKNQMAAQIGALQQFSSTMTTEFNDLKLSLQTELAPLANLEGRLQYLQDELDTLKAHLSELDFFSSNELQRNLHRVEARGNVQVDFDMGLIRLVNPISFTPKTTRDEPKAEFSRPEVAVAICRDLAEVAVLFGCPMSVEGHTKGGEGEFWQTLANDRARVVVEKIVEAGGDESKITSEGKPGKLGLNESKTIVHIQMGEEMRQSVKRSSMTDR